jgi:hypothetical protein
MRKTKYANPVAQIKEKEGRITRNGCGVQSLVLTLFSDPVSTAQVTEHRKR